MTKTEDSPTGDASDERRSGREVRDAEREERQADRDERQAEFEEREAKTAQQQDVVATTTERGLHIAEDIIYAVVALVLAGGAGVVLVEAIYEFATGVSDDVTKAIEEALSSLLIVFILVELLSAVRSAIKERRLVAEPFLLVGILAAIKELVVVTTFKFEELKPADAAIKIGVLGAVLIGLAIATLLLRRKEREPDEG
ncbi:MAG TPA: phosphate-starvation-inducible PsiE family protein [Acidimicrobiales bacterium]|nr:phosphate-starvation-inducible PsiE family protein [Acidimicrobiales bacterium]